MKFVFINSASSNFIIVLAVFKYGFFFFLTIFLIENFLLFSFELAFFTVNVLLN